MKRDTRLKLLDAGVAILHTQGYHKTGIKQVLDHVEVPKGSFYHYFESKEAFGHAVLDHYSSAQLRTIEEALSDPAHPPLDRLRQLFEALIVHYTATDFQGGCLLGNTSQEMGNVSAAFEAHCEREFVRWRQPFAACLREAQGQGQLSADLDADEVADFLLNSWEGALLRMKVARSAQPLESFVTLVFDGLLAPA